MKRHRESCGVAEVKFLPEDFIGFHGGISVVYSRISLSIADGDSIVNYMDVRRPMGKHSFLYIT